MLEIHITTGKENSNSEEQRRQTEKSSKDKSRDTPKSTIALTEFRLTEKRKLGQRFGHI